MGKKCFEFWFYSCSKPYLVPFTRTPDGKYIPLDRKSKLIHHFVWFVKLVMLLHKLVGLASMLLYEGLKMETFMCTSHFLIYLVSFSISLSMIGRPMETMDLLNGFPLMLSCLKGHRRGVTMFDDLSASFKLIAVLVVTQGIALPAALLSLTFSTLPTCWFPTAESLGLIPDGLLPRLAWQLIFFPLEYATYLPPMFSASLAGSLLGITVGVHKMVGHEIRQVPL